MCMSAWGAVPDDLDFEFNPIRDTSDEERAGLIQQTASAIVSVYQAGIISQQTALKELRQSGSTYGMWGQITDEEVEAASDMPQGGEEGPPGGEMPGMPGVLPGQAEETPEQPARPER